MLTLLSIDDEENHNPHIENTEMCIFLYKHINKRKIPRLEGYIENVIMIQSLNHILGKYKRYILCINILSFK